MALKNTVQAVPGSSLDSSTFDGVTYQTFRHPLPHPCIIMRLLNASNSDVTVSYDGGATAHDFILGGDTLQLDFTTNKGPNNFSAYIAQGTTVSVVGPMGAGSLYLVAYYQPQGV